MIAFGIVFLMRMAGGKMNRPIRQCLIVIYGLCTTVWLCDRVCRPVGGDLGYSMFDNTSTF